MSEFRDSLVGKISGTQLRCSGDSGLLVEFEQKIHIDVAQRVWSLLRWLDTNSLPGIVDAVPAYCTVFIHYCPAVITLPQLCRHVAAGVLRSDVYRVEPRRRMTIPVHYGGSYGPDLPEVARVHGLTARQVVEYHAGADYCVFFTGFLPGFPFLGGMPEAIATPRLPRPRLKVPAGAVGIAQTQTGIYPLQSPGGWRIIGQTPTRLFDLHREEPFLLHAGDYVRFEILEIHDEVGGMP